MDTALFRILAGLLLVFFGRKLFWFFIGLLGFITGFTLATQWFPHESGMFQLIIAVGCGLIGVLLFFFLKRVAIAVAGFLAGGFFATALIQTSTLHMPPLIPYVIGGILGAILLSMVFDWALIILTALTGATLVARAATLDPIFTLITFVVLVIAGVFFQSRYLGPTPVAQKA